MLRRSSFALALLVLAAFIATLTIPSPQAQAPEATAEPIMTVRRVLSANSWCEVLSDGRSAAVANRGVVDLVTGEQRVTFDPPADGYPFTEIGADRLLARGSGIYDLPLGSKLIDLKGTVFGVYSLAYAETDDGYAPSFYAAIRRKDDSTVHVRIYDVRTLEVVFEREDLRFPPPGDGSVETVMRAWPGLTLTNEFVLVHDGQTLSVYNLFTGELLYTRAFELFYWLENDQKWLVVSGEDVRDIRTNEVITRDIPVIRGDQSNPVRFTEDFDYMIVQTADVPEATLYDLIEDNPPVVVSYRPSFGQSIVSAFDKFAVDRDANEIRVTVVEIDTGAAFLEPKPFQYRFALDTGGFVDVGPVADHVPLVLVDPDAPVIRRRDGFYDRTTGDKIASIDVESSSWAFFNDDYTLAVIPTVAVYDLVAGTKLYDVSDYATISPDGRFIAERLAGIRDARTGTLLYPFSGTINFTPDSRYGIYRGSECVIFALPGTPADLPPVATPQQVAPEATAEPIATFRQILADDSSCMMFAEHNAVAVLDHGIIDLITGETRAPFDPPTISYLMFELSAGRVLVPGSGVYDVATGDKILDLTNTVTRRESFGYALTEDSNHAVNFAALEYLPAWGVRLRVYDVDTLEVLFEHEYLSSLPPLSNDPREPPPLPTPPVLLTDEIAITFNGAALTAFDLASGETLYTRPVSNGFWASPDGRWLATWGTDVRDIRTNEVVHENLPELGWPGSAASFIAGEANLAIHPYTEPMATLYDLTGERAPLTLTYPLENSAGRVDFPRFEIDRNAGTIVVTTREYLSAEPASDFVNTRFTFDLDTGELVSVDRPVDVIATYATRPPTPIQQRSNGFYWRETGERIVEIDPPVDRQLAGYTTDFSLAIISGHGVYDLVNGVKLYDVERQASISPDGRYVVENRVGIRDARSGTVVYPFRGKLTRFSEDSRYAYDSRSDSCNVVALPGTPTE
ncbi:MAG: hypothetical protein IPM16_20365 [Chloroflexi bacterium]|nr:hypothetical protein [Chloroflexota bacterium]